MPGLNLTLKSIDESQLWRRLDDELKPKVRDVAQSAAALLRTVTAHMPLYTLHDERHILNIVGWMDWLLEDTLDGMTPLEAALCLFTAYTHDLGMALSAREHHQLLTEGADPTFQRFRDQFPEHNRHIAQLRAERNYFGAQVIENHVVTDYLRQTHADRHAARMKAHLDTILADASNPTISPSRGSARKSGRSAADTSTPPSAKPRLTSPSSALPCDSPTSWISTPAARPAFCSITSGSNGTSTSST